MTETTQRSMASIFVCVLMFVAGLAAFAVPLHHPGPYGIPGRGLVGGLLCFAAASVLFLRGTPKMMRGVVLAASPVVLFFALYGALAELEEVIVLYTEEADLRLWVVDHDDVEWVSMPRVKASTYAIDGARLERLRGGEKRCVVPRIVDDPIANRRTFDLRQEKYAVQRLAETVGLFGDSPNPESITLRFDSCD